MNQEIYRRQAIERLASAEQFDHLAPITQPRAWLALIGMGLIMLVALLWSIFAAVETTVSGYGTLERLGGITPLKAPLSGTVDQLAVGVDQAVKREQFLASMRSAAPEEKTIAIKSPADGRVLVVHTAVEQAVSEGDALLTIESPEVPLSGILYVAAAQGYQVKAGMSVKILPATASKHDPEFLNGRVLEAGRYPVEQHNNWIGGGGPMQPVLKIVVALEPGRSHWSIYSGTPCQAQILVETLRPIDFIFPGLRH